MKRRPYPANPPKSPFKKGGLGVADLSDPPFAKGGRGDFSSPGTGQIYEPCWVSPGLHKRNTGAAYYYFYDGNLVLTYNFS